MRLPVTICMILALAAISLNAQTTPPPSSGATYLGTYAVRYEFEVTNGTARQQDVIDWNVCLWRNGSGGTELTIAPASIVVDDEGLIDDMSAEEIFNMLAEQGVRRGITLGHLTAPSSCSLPAQTTVSYASCVNRYGSGSNTTFNAATSTLVRQTFSFCSTTVASTGCTGATSCDGTTEPTCTSGAWLN